MDARPFVSVAGGVLVGLGSLLPWATVQSGFGSLSLAGTNGDGFWTLMLGVVIAFVALPVGPPSRWRVLLLTALSVVVVGIGLLDLMSLTQRIEGMDSTAVLGSVGIGLWIVLVGGVVAIAGSFIAPTERA